MRGHHALRRRTTFLAKVVLRHRCGIVELPDAFASDTEPEPVTVSLRPNWSWKGLWHKFSELWDRPLSSELPSAPWLAYQHLTDQRPEFIAQQLRQQVLSALAGQDFFNADSHATNR